MKTYPSSVRLASFAWQQSLPFLLLVLLTCSSCGLNRYVSRRSPRQVYNVMERDSVLDVLLYGPRVKSVEAKGKLSIRTYEKEINSNCQMMLQRGQWFLLSARPLGLFEAGRLVITPSEVLVLDRLHKEAFRSGLGKMSSFLSNYMMGWDLASAQCLLLGEPFTPEEQGLQVLRHMEYNPSTKGHAVFTKKEGMGTVMLDYDEQRLLREVHCFYGKGESLLACYYHEYTPLSEGGPLFPSRFTIVLRPTREKERIELNFSFSRLRETVPNDPPSTKVPEGYRSLSWKEIYSRIKDSKE